MRRSSAMRILPGPRLAAGVAAGAAVLAAGAVAGPAVIALDILWLAVLGIATIADWRSLCEPPAVERDAPGSISLGDEAEVVLRIESRCSYPADIEVRDSPPPELGAERLRFRASVGPRQRGAVRYEVRGTRRGAFSFGDITVRTSGRLGMIAAQSRVAASREVRVLPDMRPVRERELLARVDRRNLMGLREKRLRGSGTEFHSLREWTADDGMRRVDWKATARRGKLIARDYEMDRNQNIVLALDLGRTMASRVRDPESGQMVTKADCAVNACVLMAWVAAQAKDHVGLAAFSEDMQVYLPPRAGEGQFRRIVHALTALEPEPREPAYRQAFVRLANAVRRRSLIVLFTDLIDPGSADALLKDLQHISPQHLALVVTISDFELRDVLDSAPSSDLDVYRQAVAATMMSDRSRVLASLESRGVLTLDASPASLTIAAVNRYLDIKKTGRL